MAQMTVEIERTKWRRIVLAALTGYTPPDLREESPEKLQVSDLQIKDFLVNMTPKEAAFARGKYGSTFIKNANGALARLAKADIEKLGLAGRYPNGRSAGSL